MSYIPDCRPKIPIGGKEINPYWYGLLEGEDKEFVCGYDWCTHQALCNLFDNLDVYADELQEIGIDVDEIDMDIVNGAYGAENNNIHFNSEMTDQRECKYYEQYSEEELLNMTISTRRMLGIKSIILDYIENERDMLVTSMIEDMDDKDHERRMKEVADDRENPKPMAAKENA